ncbi:CAP domain-containing protein [Streptomyces sp. F001]|uniref:CAP domain-containing protein n=1 Tax=Streptomyces sp. F001 TaxID=1510026 RepID=UPI00101E2558|nr:CAP domain-containing protein [Streptomyces sp. F001]RZB13961.1 CAP domain-containing protein [Streptomyces sp. F001]
MRKHRRKTRHRHIAIAAVALSALAVPSAAMACLNDEGAEGAESYGQWENWKNAASQERWQGREWTSRPAAPASQAPTAPSSQVPTPPTSTEASEPKTSTSASPSTTDAAAPASGAVARVVSLVNSERSKAGCSPVTVNAKLTKAAQDHSADMASHKNMSHTGSDGSDPGERITRAGYNWRTYGENVAYGYSSPEQVMAGWMSSPGHKRNILNCGFKEIGVGLAQPGNYWTQNFGTAR